MVSEWLLRPIVQALEKDQAGRATLRQFRLWRSRRNPSIPRVLCVGYRKTGTTSFGQAMRKLGFSHYGYDPDLHQALLDGDLNRCLDVAERFDSLDDLPWSEPLFVEAFRQRFPGSRYVLLDRDESEWLVSYQRYFKSSANTSQALSRLRLHNTRMLNILGNEPHLLRMNICSGDGYEKLCPFLGIDYPDIPFPRENASKRTAGFQKSPQWRSPKP